jgi:biotin operon repressor
MGGNGATRFYPVERMMRDLKMNQIAAGTSEILKLLIYRQGLRRYMTDLKAPIRAIDEELGIPIPVGASPAKKAVSSANDVLVVLAENYRINPGLHMTMDDLKELLDISDTDLEKYLLTLEEKGLAVTYRDRRGNLALARVSYKGLNEANAPEYYRYMPSWVNPSDLF